MTDIRTIIESVQRIEKDHDTLDINLHDSVDIELNENFVIETGVVGFTKDGIVLQLDEDSLEYFDFNGILLEDIQLDEIHDRDSIEAAYNAIKRRVDYALPGLYKEYGNEAVEAAMQDQAEFAGSDGLEEIGSSDVSIWVNYLVKDLKAGYYKPSEVSKDNLEELDEIKKLTFGKTDELDEAKYHGRTVPLGKRMQGDVKKSKVYVRKPNGKIVKVNFGDKNMRIKKSNPKRRKSFRARHHCENPGPRWKARYWSCRAW